MVGSPGVESVLGLPRVSGESTMPNRYKGLLSNWRERNPDYQAARPPRRVKVAGGQVIHFTPEQLRKGQ